MSVQSVVYSGRGNRSLWSSSSAFLEFPATEDTYMGDRHMRGPLSYHSISLSRKEDATAFSSANRRKIIMKIAIKHLFLPIKLE